MKKLKLLGRYKKDLKRIHKRGKDIEKLENVVTILRTDIPLPLSAHPHKLAGEWEGFWECHIEPDWLLIYDVTEEAVLLAGTGSHPDLFE